MFEASKKAQQVVDTIKASNGIKSDVSGMCFLQWSKRKPKPSKECLLLVATFIVGRWDYTLFQIMKTDFEDKWYWGLFTADGDEWGDYSDLTADRYCVMKPLGGSKKHFR